MEKIYLFLALCCCLLPTHISTGEMTVNNCCETEREIILCGDFPINKSKPLIKPIQVFINDQSIEIVFNDTLGMINVSIVYSETETVVYQNSVNVFAKQRLLIDITLFDPGEHTIKFVNSQKKYLSGDYMI